MSKKKDTKPRYYIKKIEKCQSCEYTERYSNAWEYGSILICTKNDRVIKRYKSISEETHCEYIPEWCELPLFNGDEK